MTSPIYTNFAEVREEDVAVEIFDNLLKQLPLQACRYKSIEIGVFIEQSEETQNYKSAKSAQPEE